MRLYFLLIIFLMISESLTAQDTLYIKKQLPVAVKILSINNDNIRYKRYDNLHGPDYVTRSSVVEKIIYENGTIQTVVEPVSIKKEKSPRQPKNYKWHTGKTSFQLVASDLLLGLVTIEPERSFLNGRLSLRGMFSYGLIQAGYMDTLINMDDPLFIPSRVQPKTLGHYGNGKHYSTGASVYYFTDSVKKFNYFAGIGVSYGEFSYRTTVYTFNPDKPIAYLDDDGYYYSYFVRNGVFVPLSGLFHVSLTAGVGMNRIFTPSYYSGYNNPPGHTRDTYRAVEFGLAVGVRF